MCVGLSVCLSRMCEVLVASFSGTGKPGNEAKVLGLQSTVGGASRKGQSATSFMASTS